MASTPQVSRYRRVLLKLSGEAQGKEYPLEDGSSLVAGFDTKRMRSEAEEIKDAIDELGVEFVLVIGGGNIFRGKDADGIDKNTADYVGMLATVQNAMMFEDLLRQAGVNACMNSSLHIEEVCEPYRYKKVKSRLNKGQVVLCAGGLGEPGFTTDTTAAQRAMNLDCEAILMAKQGTDGIYDADPRTNPDANKLDILTHLDVIERDLKVMDATAATHAREHGIDIVVYDGSQPGMLAKVLCHPEQYGSVVRTAA